MELVYASDKGLQNRYMFEECDMIIVNHIEEEIKSILDEINKINAMNINVNNKGSYKAFNIEGDNCLNRNNSEINFILIDEYFRRTLENLPVKVRVQYKLKSYCGRERNRIKNIPFYIDYVM